MPGRLLTTAALALLAACGTQAGVDQPPANQVSATADGFPLVDLCAVARDPRRFDGRRIRLRAILVQDVEFAWLTSPACMGRRWDGEVAIDRRSGWDSSGMDAAITEASRRSTASRTMAAEAEFEGTIHARPNAAPVNHIGRVPPFFAMLDVSRVGDVRLIVLR